MTYSNKRSFAHAAGHTKLILFILVSISKEILAGVSWAGRNNLWLSFYPWLFLEWNRYSFNKSDPKNSKPWKNHHWIYSTYIQSSFPFRLPHAVYYLDLNKWPISKLLNQKVYVLNHIASKQGLELQYSKVPVKGNLFKKLQGTSRTLALTKN